MGEAILRWEGEGFRTYRLERLLDEPEPPDPESVMVQYEADAEQLLEMRAEAESLAPEMAGAAQLTDPGNMAAAEAYLQRVREGAVPPAGPAEHWLLDDLIEGPGNRMAVRAAQAAIAEPGQQVQPASSWWAGRAWARRTCCMASATRWRWRATAASRA